MASTSSGLGRSSMVNFFVYNIEYGKKEGMEHEKIMLFIPQEENEDNKIKQMGLCEALSNFCRTFQASKHCECLTTKKRKQYFFNPEGNFWIILTLSIPSVSKSIGTDGKKQQVLDYYSDDVQDPVISSILEQAYSMFVLFNGSFSYIRSKYGLPVFRQRLEFFYTRYLQTLNFGQMNLMDVYQGISYLPLEKGSFLKVTCFANSTAATFKSIKHTCVLYDEQLIWTTLNHDDMRILFKYLTTSLLPVAHEAELSGNMAKTNLTASSPSTGTNSPRFGNQQAAHNPGKFLTAPLEMTSRNSQIPKRSPRLFVTVKDKEAGSTTELHLIVYKSHNCIVCLMLELQSLTTDLCQRLHATIGPQLGQLSTGITEQVGKRQPAASDQQYRFIYFNQMNLAIKSSIHAKRTAQISVSGDIMKLLVDFHGDFNMMRTICNFKRKLGRERNTEKYDKQGKGTKDGYSTEISAMTYLLSEHSGSTGGELFAKTEQDCWVVGKRSGKREFFVILNQKNSSMAEIDEEMQRLMSSSFNNILFLE